jgi:hypothetical protein
VSSESSSVDPDDKWDEDRIVWDREELVEINKKRKKENVIPILVRYPQSNLGIRANEKMTISKCLYSMLQPHQNEFVSIWIYIIFFAYFVYQLTLIGGHSSTYHDFSTDSDCQMLFIATCGIVVTLGFTILYLVFYPLDKETQNNLESVNYMGLLIFIYFLLFAFQAGEFNKVPGFFYWSIGSVLLLAANLVMVPYSFGRKLSFWITIGWITLLVTLGMSYATKSQILVCFVPLLIEGAILGAVVLLVYFRVPERWWTENRLVQLYLNSYVIYSLFFINFVFEAQNILYLTLKLNDGGNAVDDMAWFKVSNIYND